MDSAADQISTFFQQYPMSTLPAKTKLLQKSVQTGYLFYLESGAVKMHLTTATGRSLTIHLFLPDSFFPLLSLIETESTKYDFTTLLPSTVRKVPIADLQSHMASNNEFLVQLNTRLLKGIAGLVKRVEYQSLASARARVANLLLYFAHHFSKESSGNRVGLSIKVTHQEISEWLGLSRENVSLQMKQLQREGLIATHKHLIQIQDISQLKSIGETARIV